MRRYPKASNNAITALFVKTLPPNASGVKTIKKLPRHETKNNKHSLNCIMITFIVYYTDTHFRVMAVNEVEENNVVIEDDFFAEVEPEEVFETEASR